MPKFEDCLECEVGIPKNKHVPLAPSGVKIFLRRSKTRTRVYEVSTKKLLLSTNNDDAWIFNFLNQRQDKITKAIDDYNDSANVLGGR